MRAATVAPAALLGSVLLFASSPAAAQPGRTSSLSWLRMPGADACIATQALARSVEERLGRHVFVSASAADVSVEGRVEKRGKGAGWHAVITIRDAKGALLGTRDVERQDASCETMNEPLALIIAVMIDPDVNLTAPPSPSALSLPSPPALPPAPPPPPPPAPAPAPAPPKDPLRVEGGVGAILTSGLAPALAPGAVITGLLQPPGVPLGLRGYTVLLLPSPAERDGARGTFDTLYLGGSLCPVLRRRLIVGMLCAGGQIGVIRSHAETKDRGIEEKTLPLWNLAAEARASFPVLPPATIIAGVAGILPLVRPTFEYAPTTPGAAPANLHEVSRLAVTADVGIAFFFP